MQRRRFVATAGGLLAGLAGCLGNGGPATQTTTTGSTETATETEPEPAPGTPTSTPPAPASDVFADVGCPPFDGTVDRTVCFHAVEPADADVLLTVDPEMFDPFLGDDAVEVLQFTLHNRSAWHFRFNPYAWGLERHEDGDWVHVAPDAVPDSLTALPPGATYTWELPSQLHPTPNRDRFMLLDVALRADVYAFHVAGSFGAGFDPDATISTAEPPDERVECVGLVRLDDDIDPGSGGEPPTTNEG